MRLLDLFCGAGGGAMGYRRAGFDEIVGVDLEPQPRYPFEFVQADALEFPLEGFDAYHASAPCQDHSPLAALVGSHGTGWMLAAARDRLRGKLFVLENVPGAPMRPDVILCGHMFTPRLRTRGGTDGLSWAASPVRRCRTSMRLAFTRLRAGDGNGGFKAGMFPSRAMSEPTSAPRGWASTG